jgi:hypothetical protein
MVVFLKVFLQLSCHIARAGKDKGREGQGPGRTRAGTIAGHILYICIVLRFFPILKKHDSATGVADKVFRTYIEKTQKKMLVKDF